MRNGTRKRDSSFRFCFTRARNDTRCLQEVTFTHLSQRSTGPEEAARIDAASLRAIAREITKTVTIMFTVVFDPTRVTLVGRVLRGERDPPIVKAPIARVIDAGEKSAKFSCPQDVSWAFYSRACTFWSVISASCACVFADNAVRRRRVGDFPPAGRWLRAPCALCKFWEEKHEPPCRSAVYPAWEITRRNEADRREIMWLKERKWRDCH